MRFFIEVEGKEPDQLDGYVFLDELTHSFVGTRMVIAYLYKQHQDIGKRKSLLSLIAGARTKGSSYLDRYYSRKKKKRSATRKKEIKENEDDASHKKKDS